MVQIKDLLAIGLTLVATCGTVSRGMAITVDEFGDAAWTSGDTRASGYTDINGGSQLVLGRIRTDAPPLLEDTLIVPRLAFSNGPAPDADARGSLHVTTATNDDAATLAKPDFSASLFDPTLQFDYEWYRTSGGVAAPALKLGIDTGEANASGNTAMARGEHMFDKILVYEPYHQATTQDNTWTTERTDHTTGDWWLVNLTEPSALPATNDADLRTLQEWTDAFNTSALTGNIVSIQIGVGSNNPGQDSYVDYLTFNSSAGPTTWDFQAAPVPEPTSAVLAALGLLSLGFVGWRRRRR